MFKIIKSYDVNLVQEQVSLLLAEGYQVINTFASDGEICVALQKTAVEETNEETNE